MLLLFNSLIISVRNNIKPIVNNNSIIKYAKTYCVSTANSKTLSQEEQAFQSDSSKKVTSQQSLRIAVIGVPNAGKSTFINNIINHRVCPTSSKVHTTRSSNKAIYTTGNIQLVLCDTPGLVTQREIKKYNLEQTFNSSYKDAVKVSDLITVIHDVSNAWTRNELHSTVIDTLKAYPTVPSILVLNKIDVLKSKRVLLDLIRTLTNNTLSGDRNLRQRKTKESSNTKETVNSDDLRKREAAWSHFDDVFLVSSITGNGLNDVQNYFQNSAKARNWEHSSENFTDLTPEKLIEDSVRARLLDYLPQEIPYNLQVVLEYYNNENNTIFASVQVVCPTERIERLICGQGNGRLRQITERVISDLVETFGVKVSLTISTTSKKK